MPSLFDPLQLGAILAPNRILMAPLTRARSTRDHVPTPIIAEYYRQRASAGLIVSEATGISLQGLGWPYAPGIWNEEQVAGWRRVTDAVHEEGGRIISQLWHMGRAVHPSMPGRSQPVSASATTAPGADRTYDGKRPYVQARPLRVDEIPGILDDYRNAARNAMRAGFDGVQIHAANGYLLDQFLRDGANFREDEYGGPPEHRIRLLCEVATAVADTVGPDRLSVRLSPNGERRGVDESDPETLFTVVAQALSEVGVAFLEIREPGYDGTFGQANRPPITPRIRKAFARAIVLGSDFDYTKAQEALDTDKADAISFGRSFISNPDLPRRLRQSIPLTPNDQTTWYSQGSEGYIDYPSAA